MDESLKNILEEFEKLKGQHVIVNQTDVVRLIAIGDDKEDYCYVCWDGRKTRWYSCLCHLIPLRGHIRKKDYMEIVRIAKLNHYDSPEVWGSTGSESGIEDINKQAKEEAEILYGKSEFVTPVCWDIN
jgi:hypothetical protein